MPDKIHIVKQNENLYEVAKQHKVSFNELKAKNPQLKDRKPPYGINKGDKVNIPQKELVKKEVGATTQTCQLCTVEELKLQCGHSDRKIEITVYIAKLGRQTPVVQVIAGSKKADLLTIKLLGKCKQGKPAKSPQSEDASKDNRPNQNGSCPTVLVTGRDVLVQQPSPVKVNIYAFRSAPCNEDFIDFFKRVLVPNAYPEVYAVSARTCSLIPDAQVLIHAVPQSSWSGKVSLGYSYGTHKNSNFNQNQGYKKLKVNGEWKLSGELKVQYDNRTWTLGGEGTRKGGHQKDHSLTRQLFSGAQGFLNKVTPLLEEVKSDYATIAIDWPKLELSGELKNKESTKEFTVINEGTIKFAFSPLIGATFKVDILNLLLRVAGDAAGGFGALLVKIKQRAAKGVGTKGVATAKAVLSVEFTVGAKISGSLEWTVKEGIWSTKGGVDATMPFELKGKVEVEATVWIVKAGAGANLGAKTEVGAKLFAQTTDKGPAVNGQLFWSGLTIYYAYYYDIGSSEISSKKPTAKNKGKGSWKDEYSEKFVVIPKGEWPEQKKLVPLADGKL